MITITKRGKNLWRPEWIDARAFTGEIAHTSNSVTVQYDNIHYADGLYSYKLKPNTQYTFSVKADNVQAITGNPLYVNLLTGTKQFNSSFIYFVFDYLFSFYVQLLTESPSQQGDHYIYTQSFKTGPYEHSFAIRLANSGPPSRPTTYYDFQLEENTVATEYEEPKVSTLVFDEALMSGERIIQDGNKFYLNGIWHREGKEPYQTVTFSAGQATVSENASTSIVVDLSTGEIKPSIPSGTNIKVYFNQYDSWTTTNATTSAFTLSNTSLNNTYPVAVDNTVTTSGFTESTTQVVFDNPVASGSTVSVNYPVLDSNYSSQAKVFYKGAPKSTLISFDGGIELEQGMNQILVTNDYDKTVVATGSSFTIPNITVTSVQKNNEDVSYSISGNTLTVSSAVQGDVIRIKGYGKNSVGIVDLETDDPDVETQMLFVQGFSVKEETKFKETDGLKNVKIPLRVSASGNVKKIVSSDGPSLINISGKQRIITDLGDYQLYILNAQIDNSTYDEPETDSITEGFDFTAEKVVKQ